MRGTTSSRKLGALAGLVLLSCVACCHSQTCRPVEAVRGPGGETHLESRPWEVVVEPDEVDRLLVVVTAYARQEA